MSATWDMTATRLGVLQAKNASGAVVALLDVARWPVTVGRALSAHLVLDDEHVAAEHLRIDRNPDGQVVVSVLETLNGVQLEQEPGRDHHASGSQFGWPDGVASTGRRPVLHLGGLQLALRLADEPLAAEQLLPTWSGAEASDASANARGARGHAAHPTRPSRFAAAPVTWTLLAVAGVLLAVGAQAWMDITEPAQLGRQLPGQLGLVALCLVVWAGVWALATKLFMGRLQFWRHVRIACAGLLASETVSALASVLAFVFSLEVLSRFELQLFMLCLAVVVYWHLAVTAPQRKRFLAWLAVGLASLGLAASLGTSWLQNQRLSNQLYMTHVYPPGWRIAKGVGIGQFMDETARLKQKLDVRLKDRAAEGDNGDNSDD